MTDALRANPNAREGTDDARSARHDVGVVFVHGIGQQARGDTLLAFSEPLISWLREWLNPGWSLAQSGVTVEALEEFFAQLPPQTAAADEFRLLKAKFSLDEWQECFDAAVRECLDSAFFSADARGVRELLSRLRDLNGRGSRDSGKELVGNKVAGTTSAKRTATEAKAGEPRRRVFAASVEVHDFCDQAPDPAHAILDILLLGDQGNQTRSSWLLAESCWADSFAAPSYREFWSWAFQILPWTVSSHFGARVRSAWASILLPDVTGFWKRTALRSLGLVRLPVVLAYLVLGGFLVLGLLPLLVLALLLTLLPIPKARDFLLALQNRVTSVLGDSYVLTVSPLREAAILSRLLRDTEWARSRCRRLILVAHSQGAALAFRLLRRHGSRIERLITLGSGIRKLEQLSSMAEPVRRIAARRNLPQRRLRRYLKKRRWKKLKLSTRLTRVRLIKSIWTKVTKPGVVAGWLGIGALSLLILPIACTVEVLFFPQLGTMGSREAGTSGAIVSSEPRTMSASVGTGPPRGATAWRELDPDAVRTLWLVWDPETGDIQTRASLTPLSRWPWLWAGCLIVIAPVVLLVVFIGAAVAAPIRGLGTHELTAWIKILRERLRFEWTDFYASADPVPNGPLVRGQGDGGVESVEVNNRASPWTDHNSYWQNREQFVSEVAMLIAAEAGLDIREMCPGDAERLTEARRRRRWRTRLGFLVRSLAGLASLRALWLALGSDPSLPRWLEQAMQTMPLPWAFSVSQEQQAVVVRVTVVAFVCLIGYQLVRWAWQRCEEREADYLLLRLNEKPRTALWLLGSFGAALALIALAVSGFLGRSLFVS